MIILMWCAMSLSSYKMAASKIIIASSNKIDIVTNLIDHTISGNEVIIGGCYSDKQGKGKRPRNGDLIKMVP